MTDTPPAPPNLGIVLHRDLDAAGARKITERIKSSMGDIMADIAKAHIGRVWIALGYSTWGDYIKGEFDHAPLSLPTAERRAVVSLLRGQKMSTRAIAAAAGVGQSTISDDVNGNRSPDLEPLDVDPVTITGLDGKTYGRKPYVPPPPPGPRPSDGFMCGRTALSATLKTILHRTSIDDLQLNEFEDVRKVLQRALRALDKREAEVRLHSPTSESSPVASTHPDA